MNIEERIDAAMKTGVSASLTEEQVKTASHALGIPVDECRLLIMAEMKKQLLEQIQLKKDEFIADAMKQVDTNTLSDEDVATMKRKAEDEFDRIIVDNPIELTSVKQH
jgi:murein endopeptidase